MLRDGISKSAARARLAAQRPEAELREAADYIIENLGDEQRLREMAQRVLDQLLAAEGSQ